MKIYISIPISGQDIDQQKLYAQAIAEEISSLGHEPVNPFDTPEPEAYLSEKERYAYFMGEDVRRLLMCDAIFLCPGWGKSRGCVTEQSMALRYDLKIFTNLKDIPDKMGVIKEFEEKLKVLFKEYGVISRFIQYEIDGVFRQNMSGIVK